MLLKVQGIVIREALSGEKDKVITIFTKEYGKISVFAGGAKSKKGRLVSCCQLFSYCDFVVFKNKDKYSLNEGQVIESFFDITKDLEALSLGQYFLQLCDFAFPENVKSPDVLSLILNSLYLLCKRTKPNIMIKSIFELRIMCLAGFTPDVILCSQCGCEIGKEERAYFHINSGSITCENCGKNTFLMTPAVMMCMRFIVYGNIKKIFSFKASEETIQLLNYITENYCIYKLEKKLDTLDFYKSILC